MTELEIAKEVIKYLPTVAMAVGIAKIYMKIVAFTSKIESQVTESREDIDLLIRIHIDRHDEDAKKFIHKNRGDNK